MTINVNSLVSVTPGVEAPGGSNFVLNGLMLTTNTRLPIGTVPSFPNQAAVGSALGFSSTEYTLAGNYFNSFDTSTKKPGALLMAQMPYSAAVGAYLRGAIVSGTAGLAAVTNISSGNLAITIDGSSFTTGSVSLAGATSFSGAAAILQTSLQAAAPTLATFTASISARNMTVTTVASGALAPGQAVIGGTVAAGTVITGQTNGTAGGPGVYTVNTPQTVTSGTLTSTPALPTVTYDSVSQAFVIASGSTGVVSTITYPTNTGTPAMNTALGILQSQGAVLSQGAPIASGASIAGFMQSILPVARNWASFMTVFEPTLTDKVLFAAWASPLPVVYAMWDTNTAPSLSGDTTSAGYLIRQLNYNGVLPITADPALALAPAAIAALAAFALGTAASIDWTRLNGRTNLAYRTQAGLGITCSNDTTAANILGNGYSFYGAYANAGNGWVFFQAGSITGNFAWWDSYIDQIWMNNNLQTSLVNLLKSIGSIPYSPAGYGLIRTALYSGALVPVGSQPQGGGANQAAPQGPIAAAVYAGAIRAGVVLSSNEVASVNNQVGFPIDGTLNQLGWFLYVGDPGATVRLQRGSPVVIFFYMDGQSVQAINVSSTDVQ